MSDHFHEFVSLALIHLLAVIAPGPDFAVTVRQSVRHGRWAGVQVAIGIGAGNGTAGQVLVLHDMLGVNLGKMPKFVRNFMQEAGSVKGAMEAYVQAVKNGSFPDNALHAW